MFPLYKRLPSGNHAYYEAWAHEGKIYEHRGEAGTEGETRELPMKSRDGAAELTEMLDEARREGFEEFDPEEERRLIIEYPVDGMGKPRDVEQLGRLEYRLNEILGWTGLGRCDGNSIGSGTMEVCCFVVDFGLARSVVAEGLAGTRFDNYSRIYDEDGAPE
jgi:hypothetical protein